MEKTGNSSASQKEPVAPYMAIGLSTVAYCIANRRHIRKNLEIIEQNIHAAISMVNINMPVLRCILSGKGVLRTYDPIENIGI